MSKPVQDHVNNRLEDSYPRTVDYSPAPELFDPAALAEEIRRTVEGTDQ